MNLNSGLKVRSRAGAFNTFFPGLLAACLWAGCASTPEAKQERAENKEVAALRLHLETKDDTTSAKSVSVVRSSPIELSIEKEAFMDERDITSARLVDTVGGFAIIIHGTTHARIVLEMNSVARLGRRMAIASTWTPGPDATETRWLAAPVFRQPLREGVFSFTPDCTREEAEHIVRGLNNVAIKLENQPKPPKPEKKPAGKPGKAKNPDDAIKAFKEAR